MTDAYDLDAGPDPAAVAAAAPESVGATGTTDGDADPVFAVGVGPGNPEFLTPRAERAIREADVVVGFETVVDVVADRVEGDALTCGYRDEAETLDAFAERVAAGESGTAVLMGDPNHSGYQFVGKVQAAVDPPVRVIPGISSLQVAASRARTSMEATTFVTLHKSGDLTPGLERLRADVGDRHLLVLPRPYDWMPEDVAADLLDAGASPSLPALVLERLTHADESVTATTLGDLAALAGGGENTPSDESDSTGDQSVNSTAADSRFSDLSVLAVRTA
ncbi:cobalt-precorrin-7 (C(5))-methyltransferase [Halorubellus sp. JP-L1]|uniref:cobalt-precorrin-7 (C(5))-methyltransferase n=1 Tax=Halorubellus sp. JP-L1 TaxID=2715753 RepID=UPI00140921DB|nr:cobalt-precorrin-7 (C(5))-methyltransferase [Halorubellus sp. JP-L1]